MHKQPGSLSRSNKRQRRGKSTSLSCAADRGHPGTQLARGELLGPQSGWTVPGGTVGRWAQSSARLSPESPEASVCVYPPLGKIVSFCEMHKVHAGALETVKCCAGVKTILVSARE